MRRESDGMEGGGGTVMGWSGGGRGVRVGVGV